MLMGRVIGTLVPALVYDGLAGVPMLWVQPLTRDGEPAGLPVVAADSTRMAGPGELVYYESSREAALALDPWFVPVDDAIVGIVDGVDLTPVAPEPVPPPPAPPARRGRKEPRA
jgi:ethanolamine utilization protein EutN